MRYSIAAAAASAFAIAAAQAAPITPDVIYGSGNANGSFTVATSGDLELGLRAKLRYDENGNPQNLFNYDGVNTYSFTQTAATPANRSVFNFDWAINSDTADGSDDLDTYSYEIAFDTDPTAATNFTTYAPLGLFGQGYFGDNSTGNGGGSFGAAASQVGSDNVAQNSVNYGFLPPASGALGAGLFTIVLRALNPDDSTLVASTTINVQVDPVPVPGAVPLMLTGLAGIAALRRRRPAR